MASTPVSASGTVAAATLRSPSGEVSWRFYAACRAADPAWFFPDTVRIDPRALELCASCPVRSRCLESALSEPVQYGVRAGLSAAQRRALLGGRSVS